jgi:hypothetical protein
MTDNPIMIDDVDVAECFHFDKHSYSDGNTYYCMCDGNMSDICQENSDCYYKQLKRKEEECEELKKELHKNFGEKDKLHLIIDRLLEASGYDTNIASAEDFEDVYENMRYVKQQLDQLKAENEKLKAENDELKEIQLGFSQGENLYNLYRYKQALLELKELVKKDYCSEIESCEFCAEIGNCINRKILQKCEVIND